MTKEKIVTVHQVRSKLTEIVDRVAKQKETYIIAKRQKPVAVIIGIDE